MAQSSSRRTPRNIVIHVGEAGQPGTKLQNEVTYHKRFFGPLNSILLQGAEILDDSSMGPAASSKPKLCLDLMMFYMSTVVH